jgi:hypothetical protein
MGGISIMVNSSTEGNISLEEQMQIGVGGFPLSIATADLNMDSTPEIIVTNWEVEGMRIIHNFLPINEQVVDLAYDINDDGVINYFDISMLILIIQSSSNLELIGDFNFDSQVNIFDLLLLLDHI